MPPRTQSDEKYILDLVAEVLAEPNYRWQHRFPTLLGDPGPDGRRTPLPVDGYFPRHKLVVEYWERQHSAPVPIMDEGPSISGMSRGHQRRHYDQRRQEWADTNDMHFVVLDCRGFASDPEGRLQRDPIRDRAIVADALGAAGVLIEPARAGFPPGTSLVSGGCFICTLVHGSPATHQPFLLWKGREEIALLDPCPTLFGSTWVAPIAHHEQVTGDMTLYQFLALQRVVYAVAEALRLALKPERILFLAPGSGACSAHHHWQLLPCPPGMPPDTQPLSLFDPAQRGILRLGEEELSGLVGLLRTHLPHWMRQG